MATQTSVYQPGAESQYLGSTNLNTPEYYQQQRSNVNSGLPMYDAAINIPQPKPADYTTMIPTTPATAAGDYMPGLQTKPTTNAAAPTVSTDIQAPDAGAIR